MAMAVKDAKEAAAAVMLGPGEGGPGSYDDAGARECGGGDDAEALGVR